MTLINKVKISIMQKKPIDLTKYSAEEAAKVLFKEICKHVIVSGQDPKSECCLLNPEEANEAGYGSNWRVLWEGGPAYWGTNIICKSSIYADSYLPNTPVEPEFIISGKENWTADSSLGFDLGFIT